jgi:hypothetical protein
VQDVFRPQENLGKHPYRSCGKISPIRENAVKRPLFDTAMIGCVEETKKTREPFPNPKALFPEKSKFSDFQFL